MRFLFTFAGGNGHFQPLIPIARAVMRAGHSVAFAGQAAMLPVIEAAGFTAIPIAGTTLLDTSKRLPLLKLDLVREEQALREGFANRLAHRHASELLSLCQQWQPDLILCDEVDFGAMIAAERLEIPYAVVSVIASGAFIRKDVIAEPLNLLRSEYGLPPDPELIMLSRYLVLAPYPPSFRHPAFPVPSTMHFFRPRNDPVDDSNGKQWSPANGLPQIYFTLGTIFNLESGDLFERVLTGLKDLPVSVIATVGRELDPADFGPQPANIRIERYIPQELVLPHCALAISHGGSGSVIAALSYGVPMVLLPIGADQPHNADRCEALGVARVLDSFDATPEIIRSAVTSILNEPRYRKNVEPLRCELMALPGSEHALALLERLAVDKQPLISVEKGVGQDGGFDVQ